MTDLGDFFPSVETLNARARMAAIESIVEGMIAAASRGERNISFPKKYLKLFEEEGSLEGILTTRGFCVAPGDGFSIDRIFVSW